MAKYVLLAEKIIENLEIKQQLTENIFNNIRPIILELQKEIRSSKLLLNHELIKIYLYRSSDHLLTSLIDFSLVPKVSNKGEFTLWLAAFIQKITINYEKEEFDLEFIPLQTPPALKVSLEKKVSKKKKVQSFSLNDDFCNAINNYFNEIQK